MVVVLAIAPPVARVAAEVSFAVTVRNEGSSAVTVDATAFPYPSVVFEVRDRAGAPVPTGPPPVPPKERALRTLAAGESMEFRYQASNLFGIDLDPGVYTVRFHAATAGVELASPWGTFEIR